MPHKTIIRLSGVARNPANGFPARPLGFLDDPVRQQIDDAVVHALGLGTEWVATIRRELAREPSVTDSDGKELS